MGCDPIGCSYVAGLPRVCSSDERVLRPYFISRSEVDCIRASCGSEGHVFQRFSASLVGDPDLLQESPECSRHASSCTDLDRPIMQGPFGCSHLSCQVCVARFLPLLCVFDTLFCRARQLGPNDRFRSFGPYYNIRALSRWAVGGNTIGLLL
jgi:hypothetical protein